MTIQEITAAIEAKSADIVSKGVEAKAEGLEPEAKEKLVGEVKTLVDEVEALQVEKKSAEELDGIITKAQDNIKSAQTIVNRPNLGGYGIPPVHDGGGAGHDFALKTEDWRAIKAYGGSITAFAGESRDEQAVKAYGFGTWLKATQFGDAQAMKTCERIGVPMVDKNGYEVKAQSGSINAFGGALVPQQFIADLILLRERYGKFRQNARLETMTSDTALRPRQNGGPTAYWVAEGVAPTESTNTYNDVALSAKTLSSLLRYSREVEQDSALALGNLVANDFAWAHEKKLDDAAFIGDGSATYGTIKGIVTRLTDAFTASGGTGLIQGAGNSWGAITLANLESVAAALPIYAEGPTVKWYVSKQFYYTVMVKLMLASGGVTSGEVARGAMQQFLGYPVEFVVSMPSATASAQVCALLANLPIGAMLGDRNQMSVETDRSIYFTQRQIAVLGYERLDVNVHDVGSTGVAGPIVGLITS